MGLTRGEIRCRRDVYAYGAVPGKGDSDGAVQGQSMTSARLCGTLLMTCITSYALMFVLYIVLLSANVTAPVSITFSYILRLPFLMNTQHDIKKLKKTTAFFPPVTKH